LISGHHIWGFRTELNPPGIAIDIDEIYARWSRGMLSGFAWPGWSFKPADWQCGIDRRIRFEAVVVVGVHWEEPVKLIAQPLQGIRAFRCKIDCSMVANRPGYWRTTSSLNFSV
jgi:hypothetical protein